MTVAVIQQRVVAKWGTVDMLTCWEGKMMDARVSMWESRQSERERVSMIKGRQRI